MSEVPGLAIFKRIKALGEDELKDESFGEHLILIGSTSSEIEGVWRADPPRYNPWHSSLIEFVPHGCRRCKFDSWAVVDPRTGRSRYEWCDLCLSELADQMGPGTTPKQVEEEYVRREQEEEERLSRSLTPRSPEEQANLDALSKAWSERQKSPQSSPFDDPISRIRKQLEEADD